MTDPIGWRPWIDVAAATIELYAAIAGTGWLLFEDIVPGLIAWSLAAILLGFAIRGASSSPG